NLLLRSIGLEQVEQHAAAGVEKAGIRVHDVDAHLLVGCQGAVIERACRAGTVGAIPARAQGAIQLGRKLVVQVKIELESGLGDIRRNRDILIQDVRAAEAARGIRVESGKRDEQIKKLGVRVGRLRIDPGLLRRSAGVEHIDRYEIRLVEHGPEMQ